MPDLESSTAGGAEPRTGLIIPTLNAGARWGTCLAATAAQTFQPARRLVVDSESGDDTVSLARKAGFEVKIISRAEFNHGGTRQWALEVLADCEIIVYLTQDAILADSTALSELVGCFADPAVAVAYGRQLPHTGAAAIEAHARLFNYGEASQRKDLAARGKLGAKVFFCSNSFAAYRRSTLLALGGFRDDLIIAEDAEFAARAVLAGYANVYCATARVYHSHDYTAAETFRRYFDTGVFHARNAWMREKFGSHGGEGLRFVSSELEFLAQREPSQIPRALLHSFAKMAGYRLGRSERLVPARVKPLLSMTPRYWRTRL